jgi:CzcA family heavy metal efflux pump
MIAGLINWSLRNRAAILAIAGLLLILGSYTAVHMPVDIFPDLTAPTVTVITEARGMAPTEVESQVTFPIEAAVNGASGVRRVRSATAVGLSIVWIEFGWGTDIYEARQIVSEKVNVAAGELPPEVERPVLAPVSSIMGEILFLSLTSDQHTPMELRTTADTLLRRRLLSVSGVSQVTPIGGGEKQFQVLLSPARLQAHDLSLAQVVSSLEEGNENVSAGFINERSSEWLVTGLGRMRSLQDIGETAVKATNGIPTKVADLGEVRVGEAPKRGSGAANGKPAVILGVQKQPGANTLKLTKELDGVLDEVASKLPAGMKIDKRIFRQADFIEVAIHNVLAALRDGGLLVVGIVLLFLANVRATVITLTAIPLSLVVTVLAMQFFGATINTMTLGGMAIAIGALVDDAVILVENVLRRLRLNASAPPERRRPTMQVVFNASVEIQNSIVFATLIITLVFLPIFFLSGVEGRLLKPLGVAYIVSLGASLLVALTVSPVLCHLLLPASKAVQEGKEPKVVSWLKHQYARILHPVLSHPWRVTIPATIVLGLALLSTGFMGHSFLPEFNEGTLTLSAVTLPGTSLPQAEELGQLIDRTLLSHPEVTGVARRQGRAELDEHAQGVESSEIDVSIRLAKRSKAEFLEALRRDFSLIPGMNVIIGQPISHRIDHMLSGTRANVAVKIYGENLYTLRALAQRAREAMQTVPGVVDLSVEQQADVPQLKVRFDRGAIARHGITVREVANTLEAALSGVRVSRLLEGQNAYDLVVRLAGSQDWSTENLASLMVDTPGGGKVPLQSLASISKDTGPNMIMREQVERKIVVMCNVAGRDVTSVVQDCRKTIDPIVSSQPGYRVEYGGQFESAAEASRIISLLGVAVVIGIGFLLHLAFGSAREAALVMLNLPLALIGGVVGVFVSGGVLSVASLIGFITVFGIATRNGIMLVSHIRHLEEHEGVTNFREAVFRGAMERLAPILMTALAAGLALIPLAFGGSKPGNEIQTPMAIVILFGLLSSMVLNMIIVPALYLRLARPVASTGKVSQ